MSRVDKLKEEIGWLKVIFAILLAVDVSLASWLAQHGDSATLSMRIMCLLAVVVTTGGIAWVWKIAYRKIDELEEL